LLSQPLVSLPGKLNIAPRCRLRFLVEGMQDVNPAPNPGGIDDPVNTIPCTQTNFLNTFPDRRHRLEIVGLDPTLNLVQLETGILPGIIRKLANAAQRIAEEGYVFRVRQNLYRYGYILQAAMKAGLSPSLRNSSSLWS